MFNIKKCIGRSNVYFFHSEESAARAKIKKEVEVLLVFFCDRNREKFSRR